MRRRGKRPGQWAGGTSQPRNTTLSRHYPCDRRPGRCPGPRLTLGGCDNMVLKSVLLWAILIFKCAVQVAARAAPLVVPEDVGTAFAAIYGFSPRILFGRDHRVGFGFRLGNHADFQLLYELGPQTTTTSLQTTTRVRAALHQPRARRRPLAELLLRAGALLAAPRVDCAGTSPGPR